MAELASPAPPKKQAGPMRWILLGCGILAGLFVLGMGGCAGIFYFIYKGTDSTAAIGAEYLRKSPEVVEAFGGTVTARRSWSGWNVQTRNDAGNAYFTYQVDGVKSGPPGTAVVWMVRKAGQWSVTGARIDPKQGRETFSVGRPPSDHHRIDWD